MTGIDENFPDRGTSYTQYRRNTPTTKYFYDTIGSQFRSAVRSGLGWAKIKYWPHSYRWCTLAIAGGGGESPRPNWVCRVCRRGRNKTSRHTAKNARAHGDARTQTQEKDRHSGTHLFRKLQDGRDRAFHVFARLPLVRPQVLEHQVLQVLELRVLCLQPCPASCPGTLIKHATGRFSIGKNE